MDRFFDEPPDRVRMAGDVLGGRYRLLRPLGEGGMSTVFLAEDLKLPGKKWAVKQTREYGISELSAAREAAVLMKLSHPYLPHVVDFFPPDEEGFSYLVMEYIDGLTLRQLAESGGPLPVQALVRYGIQLCELLQYLHEMDSGPIIFRDIKPSNIMIDARDHVRLIDFGIARKHTADRQADTVPLGTLGFAAPEMLDRGYSDFRSDLYSLGATLYCLLNDGRTYKAGTEPLELNGGESEKRLERLVMRLLDARPERRPPSAAAVRLELEQCLDEAKKRSASVADSGFVPAHESRRLRIVVGGLYPGAGATFAALSIAALLGDAGVAHAVVEHPRVRPELFGLLNGERNAPADYDYWSSRTDAGSPWKDDRTEWLALRPGQTENVSSAVLEQRLYKIGAPVTIVDIGDHWLEPELAELLTAADVCVVVADPNPARWMLPRAGQHAEALMQRRDTGREVHWIANRAVSFKGYKEWLESFPVKPSAVMPNIPYEDIVRSAWKGELVQRQPSVKPLLHKALAPWIGETLVPLRETGGGRSGSRWIGKFFSARS